MSQIYFVGVTPYMFRTVFPSIIRSSKTGRLVHRLTEDFSQPVHETAIYSCDDTRGCVMQF